MDDALSLSDLELPDRLPQLERGSHRPGSGKACVMEAASWLAGEPWSDHPRSVHKVIVQVAICVNDAVTDEARQTLWPLILASLGTARRHRPLLSLWLWFAAARAQRRGGDPRAIWEAVLLEHARRTGQRRPDLPPSRLVELDEYLHRGRTGPGAA